MGTCLCSVFWDVVARRCAVAVKKYTGLACWLASVYLRGTGRKYVLQGCLFLYMAFYAMKHQVGNTAEWYSHKRRPWPTQVYMCAEQALIPVLSSQSRWKTGHQTQKHTSDISYKTMSDQGMSLKPILLFPPPPSLPLSLSRSVDSQAIYHACPPTPQSLQTKTPAPHTPPPRTKGRTLHLPLPFTSIHPLTFSSPPSPCLIFAFIIPSDPLRLSQGYEKDTSRLCLVPSVSLADSGHMLPAAFFDWSRRDVGRSLCLSLPLRVS